ncbi:MAG: 5-(carboxyamino)imidazole ribonucleotide mutase [Endomicrobium sp.]|jgi:5-(carboxyamino)imidazole ribonucleotide mutase|nr:5-(carboxyamino)imidazole ribonucleotide mutase [Endomicrobium sp.]
MMSDVADVDVAIIVGSKSDLSLVKGSIGILEKFGLSYILNIASAHRTTQHLKQCVRSAESLNVKVFIAVAGMAAALPGVIASETISPVIGVPVDSKSFSGLDALFSIVQMPKGVPVATVAIGETGVINAAILAVQIIAVTNRSLKEKLKTYKNKMSEDAIKDDFELQKNGVEKYLRELRK